MFRRTASIDPAPRSESCIDVRFRSDGGRTFVARLAEAGALRLRQPRAADCDAIIVNTAGGIVAGDRLALTAVLSRGAIVTLTSAAAEKVYRSRHAVAEITVRLDVSAGGRLTWVPHETILFDGMRLRRRFAIDCADDASLLMVEMVQFGRTASGETDITGSLRESWRVRRGGRLVYADETAIDGAIATILDRRAIAAGKRAVATILLVAPDASRHLDALRSALASARTPAVEAGASHRDGIIVARLLATGSEPLRATVAVAIATLDGFSLPPYWH